MTTLIAFGDSHIAGAEIDFKGQGESYSKAFPAKIADHYKFNYENYGKSGGSNDYIIKLLIPRVKKSIENQEKIFLIIGMCEPTRTFLKENDNYYHYTTASDTTNYPTHLTNLYQKNLKYNSDKDLNEKSLTQTLFLQSFLKQFNIPYLMFASTFFYYGDWRLIDKNSFYGLS